MAVAFLPERDETIDDLAPAGPLCAGLFFDGAMRAAYRVLGANADLPLPGTLGYGLVGENKI